MSRAVLAVGPEAIQKALAILAEAGSPDSGALAPGMQWAGDRILLSMERGTVRFVAGSTLYRQDHLDFLLAEFPAGGASPSRASWLAGLSPYEMSFFLAMAAELTHIWPCVTNACAFLQRFGYFYRRHRAAIEHAARELRYVSEGLLALRQHEPLLFDLAMEMMGAAGLDILPKTAENRDLASFLGRVFIGTVRGTIDLAPVGQCVASADGVEQHGKSPISKADKKTGARRRIRRKPDGTTCRGRLKLTRSKRRLKGMRAGQSTESESRARHRYP